MKLLTKDAIIHARKYKELSKSEVIARSPLSINVLLSANQERAHLELNNRRVITAKNLMLIISKEVR